MVSLPRQTDGVKPVRSRCFRATGGGNYQTLISKVLREYLERGKQPTLEETLRRVIREELRTSP